MSCLLLHPEHTQSDGVAWITAWLFKRRSSSYHFPLALRHFHVVLCKYQSNNNGSEKGTETRRLAGNQNVTFPAPPGLVPLSLPCWPWRAGAAGRGEAPAGAGPTLGLPPARSEDHLRPAGPAALRGHRLEPCLKNSSAQERRELQSTRSTNFFLVGFFFFSPLYFHAPSQCNICSGGLSKEKARC